MASVDTVRDAVAPLADERVEALDRRLGLRVQRSKNKKREKINSFIEELKILQDYLKNNEIIL